MNTPDPNPLQQALVNIEANKVLLTEKFQAAVEAALDECVVCDKTTGSVTGFSFHGGRADQLAKVAGAYNAFAQAEAARHPAPNIHLTRPAVPTQQKLTPAPGTEPASMEPIGHDGP